MNPRVIKVEPLKEYKLKLHFTNNEVKIFDTNPYLNKGIFKELKKKVPGYFFSIAGRGLG